MFKNPGQAGLALATCFSFSAVLVFPGEMLNPDRLLRETATVSQAQLSEADQLREQGLRQFQNNQIESGIRSLEQAVNLYQVMGRQGREAIALENLSYMYLTTGQYEAAIAAAQRWLTLSQQLGTNAINPLIRLAWGYAYSGQYADALDTFSSALDQSQPTSPSEIDALAGLGWTSAYLGDYSQAQAYHEQALQLARDRQDISRQSYAWGGLGWTYVQLNQLEAAIAAYEQQLTLAQEIQDVRSEANALGKLGEAYQLANRSAAALQALNDSLALLTQLGDQRGLGYARLRLAEIYRAQEQYGESAEQLQQAVGIHQAIGNRRGEAIGLSQLADVMARQNNPTTAIALYKQSVSVIETIRQHIDRLSREQRDLYRETVADTYRALVGLLLDQGRFLEAQQVLELLKGNELETFTNQTRSTPSPLNVAFSQTESQLLNDQRSLIALGYEIEACLQSRCSELTTLLDQRDQINEDFYTTIDRLEADARDRLRQDRGVLDTEDFSRTARKVIQAEPNTVLIYPFITQEGLWLLWGGPGGLKGSVQVSVSERALNETILAFRQALESPDSDLQVLQQLSQQLYGWLIQPLAAEIESNQIENLVFSLDRQLRYLPMAALFDGENYLIEAYDIHTILSADLTNTDSRLNWKSDDVRVLAVGLSQAVAGFTALPGVPVEVDGIVRGDGDAKGIFPGLVFLDEAFSRTTLRDHLLGHQILHIATHGVFVAGEREQSYLVTGDGTPLLVSEIRRFEGLEDIHLVVLSACETALGGTNQDGIEISSLAYHFLNKGVKTVVASLWAVDDFSTSVLMQDFYGALATGQPTTGQPTTKTEALRQAQLRFIQGELDGAQLQARGIGVEAIANRDTQGNLNQIDRYAHPYYWAPFTLIGNGL